MGKLVAGVGVNDAGYPVVRFGKDINGKRNREWVCPFYKTWSAMLNRCYRLANDNRYNSYRETTVCQEWHTFSNFKSWMETQDWEGKELDKDLLTDNNQYSPQNCIFIPQWLNAFIIGDASTTDSDLRGVYKCNGYYIVFANKKHGWESESFLDVQEAIDKYFSLRVEFIISSDLTEHLKGLVVEFFRRRKVKQESIVANNATEFTNRGVSIQGSNLPKVGDRFLTYKGYWYTVKEVLGCDKILIEFDDGELKTTRHTRLKDGKIKKSLEKDTFSTIVSRINKIFKWNSHGLISGIQFYPPKHYGVAYKDGGSSKCFYTTSIQEALTFRENMLLERVKKIVGVDVDYLDRALKYFNSKWEQEVVKYSGNTPQDI